MRSQSLLRGASFALLALLAACDSVGVTSKALPLTVDGAGASSSSSSTTDISSGASTLVFSEAAYSVMQNGGALTVVVDRTDGASGAVSVTYSTADGTAMSGVDYTATAGVLSWDDGDAASKTFAVPILPGGLGGTSFTVSLSNPAGAALGSPSFATVSIVAASLPTPAGSIALSAAAYSIASNGGALLVSVDRSGGADGAASVSYATQNGSALGGTDYSAVSGSLTWASGDAAPKSFSIPISATGSGGKSFTVALTNASGAALGTPSSATVTISSVIAPPPAGTITFASASYATNPTGGPLTITVDRSGGSNGAVSVNFATQNGSAQAGADYSAENGTLEWSSGDAAPKSFTIPINASGSGGKSFTVTLSNASGAALGNPSVTTVSIAAQESAPPAGTLEFSSASYAVKVSSGSLVVTVDRSGGSNGAAAVRFATANGSALSGTDYTAVSGTLNWQSGDATPKTFAVPISAQGLGGKSFTVTLADASGAVLGAPSTASVSIAPTVVSQSGSIALATGAYAVTAGAGSLTVTVDRSGGSFGVASVDYSTVNGSALAGTDYTAVSGTLSWPSGSATPKSFTIPINTAGSGGKSFTVKLSQVSGATLGTPSTASVSIAGTTPPPPGTLALSTSAYDTTTTSGTLTITVNRSDGTNGVATVHYATANGSALAGTDYTATSGMLTWQNGDGTPKTVAIPISAAGSGDKSFSVTLSQATGAALGTPSTASVAISAPPPPPPGTLSLAAASYSVSTTTGSLTIAVDRSGGTDGIATVHYATVNGSALAGTDYTAMSGTLTWQNGDGAPKTFSILISAAGKGGKTFSVTLSDATGAALSAPSTASIAIAAELPPGTLAFAAPSYSVSMTNGGITVTVTRSGGVNGIATVRYATANGSAVAGTDYTAMNGTLTWQNGDAAPKPFAIPISTQGQGNKSFTVALANATGAALGAPVTASIAISAPVTGTSALSVRVQGNHFIDANGNTLQLRGVNASNLEDVAIDGWDPADPWGGMSPNWSAVKSWKSNVVRVPLNEASWLGYQCVDGTGATRDPDPGHNYQATVKNTVAAATAAGLYVILDLHWTAPKNFCPLAQNPMADADNSINFWTSLAGTFKTYPNVLFELFNEPYMWWITAAESPWTVLMQGGTQTQYVAQDGPSYQVNYTWQSAGMQQLLNAVRATGATNVVLISGVNWSQDLSQWVANKPTDPLNQIAAVWHAYPASETVGDPNAALPTGGAIAYTWTQSVLTAGIPVFITEYGDHDADGTVGAPFVSQLLPWADAHGASYAGWTWDAWGLPNDVLIQDASGTPTDGYGVYVQAHYLCLGAGGTNCP